MFTVKNNIKVKRHTIKTDSLICLVGVYSDRNPIRGNNFSILIEYTKKGHRRITIDREESEEITSYILDNIKDVWHDDEPLKVNKGFTFKKVFDVYNKDSMLNDYLGRRIVSIFKTKRDRETVYDTLIYIKKGDEVIFYTWSFREDGMIVHILLDGRKYKSQEKIPIIYISKYLSPSESY